MNSKSHGLPKEVLNYVYNVGNRISQLKWDLINETKTLFPKNAIMCTEPTEGELLKMLVKLSNSKKGIEIGTFTGYSSICMAEGLPDNGTLECFDVSVEFTDLAKKYWKLTELDKKISLTLGPAVDSLKKILENKENVGTYDFAYVDADKPNYKNYYELMLELLRPGGFIIFDNVLWSHKVVYESKEDDEDTLSFKELNLKLKSDKRVEINMLVIAD